MFIVFHLCFTYHGYCSVSAFCMYFYHWQCCWCTCCNALADTSISFPLWWYTRCWSKQCNSYCCGCTCKKSLTPHYICWWFHWNMVLFQHQMDRLLLPWRSLVRIVRFNSWNAVMRIYRKIWPKQQEVLSTKTEEEVLAVIKILAVRKEEAMFARVTLHEMRQGWTH